MSILDFHVGTIGKAGENPQTHYLTTDDTHATVVTNGYLNDIITKRALAVSPGDMVLTILYSGGVKKSTWLTLSKTSGNWKLDNPVTA